MNRRYLILILSLMIWFLIYFNLENIVNFLIYNVLSMPKGTHLTETIWFFIFEVPKVLMLLSLIIFCVSVVRSYLPPEKTRKYLEGKPLFLGNVIASLIGIVTPFCSCSAIPLFLGFVEVGVPLGVTFSFLVAAPMINEVAVILLFGMFGWKVAVIYILTGLVIAIVSGYILGKLKLERWVESWVYQIKSEAETNVEGKMLFSDRLKYAFDFLKDMISRIWIYIIVGIGIGAAAHGYVPDNYLSEVLGKENWYAVPLAVIFGVPLYSNAAGIIPIVSVLIEKGVPLGTALAFMMAVIGLSLPEMIILKKVLKWKLIGVFAGVVAFGILVVGYLFNYVVF